MEQYVVFKSMKGYKHEAIHDANGDLVVKTVPITSEPYVSSKGGGDKTKYFVKVTKKDRDKVKEWLNAQEESNDFYKRRFLKVVKEAVETIQYDYWISIIEPSLNEDGIYYAEGETVGVGIENIQWFELAKEYAPERGSRIAELTELFMWYALRIVNGQWTFEEITENSLSSSNDRNELNIIDNMEKTGAKLYGGFKDGQGNTYKIVLDHFILGMVGTAYQNDGGKFPITAVHFGTRPYLSKNYGVAVVVLTK